MKGVGYSPLLDTKWRKINYCLFRVNSDGPGRHFGAGLYQSEVEYLVRNEWARTAEDILWRRTKLGLRMNDQETADLSSWLKENVADGV